MSKKSSPAGPEEWRRIVEEWMARKTVPEIVRAAHQLLDELLEKGLVTREYYDYAAQRLAEINTNYGLGLLGEEAAKAQLLQLLGEMVEVQAGLRKPPRRPREERRAQPAAAQQRFPSIQELEQLIQRSVQSAVQSMAQQLLEQLAQAMANMVEMLPGLAQARALMPRHRTERTAAAIAGYRFAGHMFPEEAWLEMRHVIDPVTGEEKLVLTFDPSTEYTLRGLFPLDATYFDLGCYFRGCYGWFPLDVYADRDLRKRLVPTAYEPWVSWITRVIEYVRSHWDELVRRLVGGERIGFRYPRAEPVHSTAGGEA